MKIAGIDPKLLPPEEVLVLPRLSGTVVFKARGVADYDEFDKLCPEPVVPVMLTSEGKKANTDDDGYQSAMAEYARRRWAYLVVKSLEPSEIEWDTVKLDQPATWSNWEKDLHANGFTKAECNRVLNTVMAANSLDEAKLQKAREAFLRGRPAE